MGKIGDLWWKEAIVRKAIPNSTQKKRKRCIPVNHYQYRSPEQMQKRFAVRQQAKADGCGSFSHEQGQSWQDYLYTDKQLAELTLLSHLKEVFEASDRVLYEGRNTLKIIGEDIVVKAFHRPCFPNSLFYGLVRASKAKRSYTNALRLGELTPQPLTFAEHRRGGLLRDSYYACRLSTLPLTWRFVARDPKFPNREQIARSIGRFLAQMHEKGCFPLDFSGGNILVNEDGSQVQIVDLNRMRHYAHIGLWRGCRQVSHLHLSDADCLPFAEAYAQTRGFDMKRCYRLICRNRIPI